MTDWTWEYVPDAAHVVGGLTPLQIDEVVVRRLHVDEMDVHAVDLGCELGSAFSLASHARQS
jgi:hypothetical protein